MADSRMTAQSRLAAALLSTQDNDRTVRRVIVWSMIVAMVLSGVAFAFKLAEFMYTLTTGAFAGTFDVQIIVYFAIALGWMAILIWCFVAGKFKEMEAQKGDLIEQEEEYERRGI